MMRAVLVRLFVCCLVLSSGLSPILPTSQAMAAADDWDIPNGHYYTQAAGPGESGFAIVDSGGVNFWSEFQRLGGVQAAGYPISDRFEWSGFTCQAMQRVVFQWRSDIGQVYFVNVFDLISQKGGDNWLFSQKQTPPPIILNEQGKSWQQIVDMRLALLDGNPAIKNAYFAVIGDPVVMNGLPTSAVTDMGNNYTLRAQRVVLQQWKQDVPWASKGQVTFALGGSIAKEFGLLPKSTPAPPMSPINPAALGVCPQQPVIESFSASSTNVIVGAHVTLSWVVKNANYVAIDNSVGTVPSTGTKVVQPAQTTTYTISASAGGCEPEKKSLQVTVNPAPSLLEPKPATDMALVDIYAEKLPSGKILARLKNNGPVALVGPKASLQCTGQRTTYAGGAKVALPSTNSIINFAINPNQTMVVDTLLTVEDSTKYWYRINCLLVPSTDYTETDQTNNTLTKDIPTI